jgi:hypothetical protein
MYEGTLYVAKNWGGQEAPAAFARRVIIEAYNWHARIVVEKNHGGEWLATVFAQVMKELVKSKVIPAESVPHVQVVNAHKSKRTRAEPVSALYERRVVRHCYDGRTYQITDPESGAKTWHRDITKMAELEDQMATFTGASDERSPDRLDSLVWACTMFLRATFEAAEQKAAALRWAAAQELESMGEPRDGIPRRRLKGAHGGLLDHAGGGWDLEDFAPQDGGVLAEGGDGDQSEQPPRAAVHGWR